MTGKHFDVVVIGGGMVGTALACGLVLHGFSVAIIEQAPVMPFEPKSEPDVRISAISQASVQLLQQLDVWSQVVALRCAPFRSMETWEWQNAVVRFSAQSLGISELGYMVENRVLQYALAQRAEQLGISLFCPARLHHLQRVNDHWIVTLSAEQRLTARLVVGADGAQSQVRQQLGLGISGWRYRQDCMLISVTCADLAGDTTWQQFTPDGPRAFLPLHDHYASLVWYDHPARLHHFTTLSPCQRVAEIKRAFPRRLGEFTVNNYGQFPLIRRHAYRYVVAGAALVGDAAHTIHPLAGQGVNLGYRDVEALLTRLLTARDRGEVWWSKRSLEGYQTQRYRDNVLMQSSMDAFYLLFSNDHFPVKIARNIGFILAQRAGALKRQVLRYALGLT